MSKNDVFVSLVAPLHNAASFVAAFIEEAQALLAENFTNYEIVLVDDASTDDTRRRIEELLGRYPCMRLLPLSRRMGEEVAIAAGLESAIGDFVVTIDANLDPLGLLPAMVSAAQDGRDLVLGVVSERHDDAPVFDVARRGYRLLCRWLLQYQPPTGLTAYRVLSRRAVNAVTRFRRRRRYFPAIVAEIGFPFEPYSYEWQKPRSGVGPPRRLFKSIHAGASVLLHHSTVPIRGVAVLGLFGSLLSMLAAIYVVLVNIFKNTVAPGWTTLSLQMSGLFFLVFLMLAMIAEYIARMIDETDDRPLYHPLDEKNSSVMLAQPGRTNVLDESTLDPQRRSEK